MKQEMIRYMIKIVFAVLKLVVFAVDHKLNRTTVFHEVRTLWGEPMKKAYDAYFEWHHTLGRAIILESREGLLINAHGCADGLVCLSNNMRVTVKELASMLPAGKFYLLSCYNGTRQDYSDERVSITRVSNTRKRYVSIAGTFFTSNLYVDCCWEFQQLNKLEKLLVKKFC